MTLTLQQRMALDRPEYVQAVLDGTIKGGPNIWPALDRTWLYWEQCKRGDYADESTRRERADMCRACRYATPRLRLIAGDVITEVTRWTCGQPAETRDQWDAENRTCGCPTGISLNGEPLQHAAGMAACESEECPRGMW